MAVSKRLRFEILRRDGHRCRYCGAGALAAPLTVDHITPLALGGTDDPDNLATACEPCNSGKTSTLPNPDALPLTELSQTSGPLMADVWALLSEHSASELRSPVADDTNWVLNSRGVWFHAGATPSETEFAAATESIRAAAHLFSGPVLFVAAQRAAREASTDIAQYALPLQNAVEAELRRIGQ